MVHDMKDSNSDYNSTQIMDGAEGSEASEDTNWDIDEGWTELLDELWYTP